MKKHLTKMLSIAIALALIVGLIPLAAPAARAAGNDLPAEFDAGTVVWDLENAPDSLDGWSTDKFADWGKDTVPDWWEPTTAAGKGVNGSKALRWHTKVNEWGCTSYIQFSNDSTAVTDWTGATELMFYIDASEVVNGDGAGTWGLDIGLNQSDLSSNIHAADAPWYIYENGAWTEKKIDTWGHMLIPAGYVGYIRLPISSILEAPASLDNITKILFYTGISNDIGASVYFDQFTINVAPGAPDDSGQPESNIPAEVENGTVVWDVENTGSLDGRLSNFFLELWPDNTDVAKGDLASGKMEIAVAEGKGFEGSAALMYNIKESVWGQLYYVDFSGDRNAVTDWSGAATLYFWIDNSGADGDNPVDVFLTSDGNNNLLKDAPWATYENGAWVDRTISEWNHMMIPAGYVGWVKLPLSSMGHSVNLSNVSRIVFYSEKTGTVYFDHFAIDTTGPADTGKPESNIPAEVENGTVVWDVENTGSLDGRLSNFFLELWPDNTDVAKGDLASGKMEIAVAEGKGFEGSAALMYNIKESVWGQTYYVDFSGDKNAVTNWSGAATLYFWIDNSGADGDNPVDVFLTSDGNNNLLKDAPWATYENGAWVDRTINEWNHMMIPAGYVGWVKLPLSSMGHSVNLSNVSRIVFYSEKTGTVYFDHFVIDTTGPADTGDAVTYVVLGLMGASVISLAVLVIGKKRLAI